MGAIVPLVLRERELPAVAAVTRSGNRKLSGYQATAAFDRGTGGQRRTSHSGLDKGSMGKMLDNLITRQGDRAMMLPAPRHDDDKLAAQFAKWAAELTWDHLPTSTRATAARALLDLMGDMAAGRGLLGMPPWLSAILEFASGGGARLIGGGTAAPAVAALVNGYFVHALELDDTHDEAVLHAGAAVIAAVLAAVDHRGGVSGQELLTAMVVGIELVCR